MITIQQDFMPADNLQDLKFPNMKINFNKDKSLNS